MLNSSIRFSLSILFILFILASCSSDSSTVSGGDWCYNLTYGLFEAKTEDGITVTVQFTQLNEHPYYNKSDGFFITYTLPNGDELIPEGGTKLLEFFEIPGNAIDIKPNTPIELKPDAINFGSEYITSVDRSISPITIKYIDAENIHIDFPNAKEFLSKISSAAISDKVNSIQLSKTCGISDCMDFNPLKSYNQFEDVQQGFLDHDVDMMNGWRIAGKELMLDYLLREPEIESMAWGAWNRSLEDVGSVFVIDLNGDGEKDVCGYFTHEFDSDKKLVFKIFLHNGVSYDEMYSKNMSEYSGGEEVFYPSEMNGKPVIGCSFLDQAGYCLFYNKLSSKIEQKFFD